MLRKVQIKNFKNFYDSFVFDLSSTKNYEFNSECVKNGIVANAIIYGPNGCGKTNLGYAIFDIKTHLTNEKIDGFYNRNYLNAASGDKHAEFIYQFQFGADKVEYAYTKGAVGELIFESLKINDVEVIALDRRETSLAQINLEGAESLDRDLSEKKAIGTSGNLSVVKYVGNSTVLQDNHANTVFKTFFSFVDDMTHWTTETTNGFANIASDLSRVFIQFDLIKGLQTFLIDAGIKCQLTTMDVEGKEILAFEFGDRKISFWGNASRGTLNLALQYLAIHLIDHNQKLKGKILEETHFSPFVFIDEFDAFYHHAVSKIMVEALKKINCQFILTTHNTNIMSNDLLRPDCYFLMSSTDIRPAYTFTDKELRKAHNIEKMYRAGVFDE